MRRLLLVAALGLCGGSPLAAAELEVKAGAAAVGSFGLDVTVGSTCSTPDEVIVESPPVVTGDLEACQNLTVRGVEVNGSVDFVAGASVILGADLTVAEGATLAIVLDSMMPGLMAYIGSGAPIAEQTFQARFHLRLDSLSLAEGDEVDHLRALAADGAEVFRVILRRQAGQNLLALGARLDTGGEILTPAGQEVLLPPGWNQVELDWRAGDGDGRLLVSVNQAAFVGLDALTNGLAEIERFHWGAVDGTFAGTPGRLEVDGFSAWR